MAAAKAGWVISDQSPSPAPRSGSDVVLPDETTLYRFGYVFKGWNTKADGTGDAYAAGDTFTTGITEQTLYAMWEAGDATYFIDYYKVRGDGTLELYGSQTDTGTTGQVVTVTAVQQGWSIPDGYRFVASIEVSGTTYTSDTHGTVVGWADENRAADPSKALHLKLYYEPTNDTEYRVIRWAATGDGKLVAIDENGNLNFNIVLEPIEDGRLVQRDSAGNPVAWLDADGNEFVITTTESRPKVDENGDYVQQPVLDENGNPVEDENGEIMYETVLEDVLVHTTQYRYWSIQPNGAVLPLDVAGNVDAAYGSTSERDGVTYHLPDWAMPAFILHAQGKADAMANAAASDEDAASNPHTHTQDNPAIAGFEYLPHGQVTRLGDAAETKVMTVAEGSIAANGSLVLTLYYYAVRSQLTFDKGAAPNWFEDTDPSAMYMPGEIVTLPTGTNLRRPGYTLAGWTTLGFYVDNEGTDPRFSIGTDADSAVGFAGGQVAIDLKAWIEAQGGIFFTDTFTMPTGATTLYPVWLPRNDTKYTVEYYKHRGDGTVVLDATVEYFGMTDTLAIAGIGATGTIDGVPADDVNRYGTTFYQLSNTVTDRFGTVYNAILKLNINADGSTVLKLYYEAQEIDYKVQWIKFTGNEAFDKADEVTRRGLVDGPVAVTDADLAVIFAGDEYKPGFSLRGQQGDSLHRHRGRRLHDPHDLLRGPGRHPQPQPRRLRFLVGPGAQRRQAQGRSHDHARGERRAPGLRLHRLGLRFPMA